MNYVTIAASQTDQLLGSADRKNDFLERLIISVATAATGTCSIKDGSGSSIVITAANTAIGVYSVKLNMRSTSGTWKVTTGAGCTAIAVGDFKDKGQ